MTDTCITITPAWDAESVTLPNGPVVFVRPVRPEDAELLVDGFDRLSAESRRFRFLTGKHALSPGELRFLTTVDHYDHEAIGALDGAGRGVGIARYVRSSAEPQYAEVAVTVVDAWHRRGVGTALLTRLIDRARRAGIHVFTALVSADNAAMVGLLRANAGVELVHVDEDTVEYEISLAPFARSLARR